MTKAEQAVIKGMQEKLAWMDARIKELEAGGHAGAAPTMSDVEKVLFIREAVRRDRMGDGAMVRAWNRGHRR